MVEKIIIFHTSINHFINVSRLISKGLIVDFGKEEQIQPEVKEQQPPAPVVPLSNNTAPANSERPSKRPRRTRNDTFSGTENSMPEVVPVEHTLRSQAPTSTSNNTTTTIQKKTSGKLNNDIIQHHFITDFLSIQAKRRRGKPAKKRNPLQKKRKLLLTQMSLHIVCVIKFLMVR